LRIKFKTDHFFDQMKVIKINSIINDNNKPNVANKFYIYNIVKKWVIINYLVIIIIKVSVFIYKYIILKNNKWTI